MPNVENCIELFDSLLKLEDERKELAELAKEKIEMFSEQHDLHKKAINKSFKEYKELLKNSAEFHEVDADTMTIMDAILNKEGK